MRLNLNKQPLTEVPALVGKAEHQRSVHMLHVQQRGVFNFYLHVWLWNLKEHSTSCILVVKFNQPVSSCAKSSVGVVKISKYNSISRKSTIIYINNYTYRRSLFCYTYNMIIVCVSSL